MQELSSRYTFGSARFGAVELEKGFPNFACRELNRGRRDGECCKEERLGLLVVKVGIGSKA